jgi:hypothetical protein
VWRKGGERRKSAEKRAFIGDSKILEVNGGSKKIKLFSLLKVNFVEKMSEGKRRG